MEDTPKDRVRRGAERLDELMPDWHDRLAIDKISYLPTLILAFSHDLPDREIAELGGTLVPGEDPEIHMAMREAWIDEAIDRKFRAAFG